MGRLNYKNRKSEGVKLGQIVAKDLRKLVNKSSAKQDSQREIVSLELNLHGKKLTDDGLLEVATGLVDVLRSSTGTQQSKLEDLLVSNNGLTTSSLRLVAQLVRLASYDLKNLDLSGNQISVSSSDDAKIWEEFLDSFRSCRVLRRLDLSGNKLSDPRAFEILARVYGRHNPVDPTDLRELRGQDTVADQDTDMAILTKSARSVTIHEPSFLDQGNTPSQYSLSKSTILKRRCGLRSIPYLVFSNCGITDCGALHLSYVLTEHYYPQQLTYHLRPSPSVTQAEDDNHQNHCWGLECLPNDDLTGLGEKLLEQAGKVRSNNLLGITDAGFQESGSMVVVDAHQARRYVRSAKEDAQLIDHSRRSSNLRGSLRRSSSTLTLDSAKFSGTSDLESLRKKVQRATIDEFGAKEVELWASALKMLIYARAVLRGIRQDDGLSVIEEIEATEYASHILASSSDAPDPVFAITGVSDTPVQPVLDDYTIAPKPPGATDHQLSYRQKIEKARSRIMTTTIELYDRDERDPSLPGQLPRRLWQQVLALSAGAHGVLSEEQQNSVIQYALTKENLMAERQLLGKDSSVQIWTVLEHLGCLEYDMRV